jgi:hypothetical protein
MAHSTDQAGLLILVIAMTFRDKLNDMRGQIAVLFLLGMLICSMGAIFWTMWLFIVGAVIMLPIYLIAYTVAFPCPHCGVRWGSLALWSGWSGLSVSIDKRIRFCPFCGVDIDSEEDSKTAIKEIDSFS